MHLSKDYLRVDTQVLQLFIFSASVELFMPHLHQLLQIWIVSDAWCISSIKHFKYHVLCSHMFSNTFIHLCIRASSISCMKVLQVYFFFRVFKYSCLMYYLNPKYLMPSRSLHFIWYKGASALSTACLNLFCKKMFDL